MTIKRMSIIELKGAPISILAVLVEAWLLGEASALTTNQLVDRTGYNSRSVIYAALRRLADHGYVVSPGTLGQGGEQFWGLSTEFLTLFQTIEGAPLDNNSTLQIKFTALPMYGVVVKDSINSLIQEQHQQTNETLQIKFTASPELSNRATALLERLNCWGSRIASVLEALHPEKGLAHLLGWIAYVHDPDNKIRNPVAVVAANLIAGQYPTTLYTPHYICRSCRKVEGRCECDAPDYHLPDSFDDLAFEAPPEWGRDDFLASRWYCSTCFAHPCQCETND